MKVISRRTVTKVMFAAAILALGGVAHAEKINLRLGFATQPDDPAGHAAQKMADVVTQLTKGEVVIKIFPNGQLGNDVEMVNGVRSGTIDVCLVGGGEAASAVAPKLQVTSLPFIWKSRETFWKTVRGPIGQELLAEFERAGIKGLAWGSYGTRGFITNGFQINGPEDLKGRKIRVTPSQVYMKSMEAMGGNAIPMPYGEVYMALQQHAVDGVETSFWAMVGAKFYEVASSVADTSHEIDSALFLMNKNTFDGLNPQTQKAIIEGATAGGEVMNEEINQATDTALGVMKKAGLTITHPDPSKFKNLVQPVYAQFAKQIGQKLIDEIQAQQ